MNRSSRTCWGRTSGGNMRDMGNISLDLVAELRVASGARYVAAVVVVIIGGSMNVRTIGRSVVIAF